MRREDFLTHVGNPADTAAEAACLDEQAQTLWLTVKGEFYTASGKPRAKPASWEAENVKRQCWALQEQARVLGRKVYEQREAHTSPWSHIDQHSLRRFGLGDVAARVAEAHAVYMAAAEAA